MPRKAGLPCLLGIEGQGLGTFITLKGACGKTTTTTDGQGTHILGQNCLLGR